MKRIIALLLICAVPALVLIAFAQNATAHSVTLSWAWTQGPGDPATGFHVWRSSTPTGTPTDIATISSPTTLTYVDTSVAAGQTWYYTITAFNSAGDSTPSNQITCVIPFSVPAAPTGLSGIAK